jgi:hypothetical protein
MPAQLSQADLARIHQFLDQISPVSKRPLTVMESGRGGPGINIPLTPDTDGSKFPRWEYIEYPKMLVRKATKEDVEEWRKRRAIDDSHALPAPPCVEKGKESIVPILATIDHVMAGFAHAVGTPLIMQTAEQEQEFFGVYPPEPKTIDVPLAPPAVGELVQSVPVPVGKLVHPAQESELDRVKRENAQLEALIAERKRQAELRAQLAAADTEDEPVKPRRRRRTKAEMAAAADVSGPADTRETMPDFDLPTTLG